MGPTEYKRDKSRLIEYILFLIKLNEHVEGYKGMLLYNCPILRKEELIPMIQEESKSKGLVLRIIERKLEHTKTNEDVKLLIRLEELKYVIIDCFSETDPISPHPDLLTLFNTKDVEEHFSSPHQ